MTDMTPPTGSGPLARREAQLAWGLLFPTIAAVSLVVVLPLLAKVGQPELDLLEHVETERTKGGVPLVIQEGAPRNHQAHADLSQPKA